MSYTNSNLVDYIKLSPNNSGERKHAIDTITIHCVVGQVSVEALGETFYKKSRKASSNYGIGTDGRIGLYVEEKNRSWCSSSASNDNRAITIEVASDTIPPYIVNDKAYKSLIKLLADICLRNDIKQLLWKADKKLIGQIDKQNMTVHRWFANKSCPGDYLYNRHTDIANEVNKLLLEKQQEQNKNLTSEKIEEKEDKLINKEGQNNSNKDKNINSNEFKVKVNVDVLNIRSGVGTSCKIVGQIKDRGVYTIVEKQGSWGKLKSGAGWISLNYCKEV